MMPQTELLSMTGLENFLVWAQSQGGYWLPPPESTTADAVDSIFYLILWISTFFFLLIVALMIAFVFLFRRRPGVEAPSSISHNNWLELTWTSIPVVIVVVIFYLGFTGYMDMRNPPREAYEIQVIAQKWKWLFTYPNGNVSEELHVPVEHPVRLVMRSEDVIHSLFIPAFRVKMDVVPGRYTQTWFDARQPGSYDLLCSEYCGTGHSDMLTKVVVHKPGEFDVWLTEASNLLKRMSPVEAGAELMRRNGCFVCHSTDGSTANKQGPSLKGIFGETHNFTDGTSTKVDENYIRQSVLEPMAKIRQGYQGIMPTFKGRLKDEEISAIIAYIKSLK